MRGSSAPRPASAEPIVVQPLGAASPIAPLPRHFFEIVFVEHGRGRYRVGGQELPVRAGDLLLCGPGVRCEPAARAQPHGQRIRFTRDALLPKSHSRDDAPARFDEPLLRPFLLGSTRQAGPPVRMPASRRAELAARISALAGELERREPGYERAARALLTLVLVDVARAAGPPERAAEHPMPLLSAVFDAIEEGYTLPISLRDVARAAGRSPGYVTTLVREATGLTVMQWLMERRMAEARRLLVETDLDIENVAERVGMSDPSWFIRRFKALHGVTPLAWRRRSRGG